MHQTHGRRAWLLLGVIAVALIGSLGAVAALWEASTLTNFVVASTLAASAGLIAAAIDTDDDRDRVWLVSGCAGAMLVAFLAVGWELSRPEPEPIELVATSGGGQTVQPVGEPGGLTPVSNIVDGTTVAVTCSVEVDGQRWYRLAWTQPIAWLPKSALRAPRGRGPPDIPGCG